MGEWSYKNNGDKKYKMIPTLEIQIENHSVNDPRV